MMARHSIVLMAVTLLTVPFMLTAGGAQTLPTLGATAAGAASECLHQADNRPSSWTLGEEKYRQAIQRWTDSCQQAVTTEPANPRLRIALSKALFSADRRAEAVAQLRAAAATGDTDALVEIYEWHKSWERGDLDRVQVVARKEAGDALRRAAELGDPFAMHRLAVLLDRGEIVKRDNAEAIRWAERSMQKPDKDWRPEDIATLLGRLLTKSDRPEEQARGRGLLERLSKTGRPDAKAYLAIAIRTDDPARARTLLEEAMRGATGAALPALADMLIKGEGGVADPARALKLLRANQSLGVAAIPAMLGQVYLDGKLVPRDPQEAAKLIRAESQWSVEATIQLARIAAENPAVRIDHAKGYLYTLSDAAELDEPGAMAALIALKLSPNSQFADREGGCKLAQRAIDGGDASARRWTESCEIR